MVNEQAAICQGNNWCTYEAVDNISIIPQIIFLSCLCIYLVILICYNVKLYRLRNSNSRKTKQMFGRMFVVVFGLLTCWAVFSITKCLINIIIYYKYMTVPTQIIHGDQPIVTAAGFFQMFDSISAYCLILLLIMIPHQWLTFVLTRINDSDRNIDIKLRKKISIIFHILTVGKVYVVLRVLTIVYFLTQPFILTHSQLGCYMPIINSIYLISQSSILLIFYLLGFGTISYLQKQQLFTISTSDYRRIRKQYVLLLFVLIMRILYHSFLRFTSFYTYEPQANCVDQIHSNKIARTILISIDHGLMHLLSVAIIVYIYKPDQKDRKIKDNVLLIQKSKNQYSYDKHNWKQDKQGRDSSKDGKDSWDGGSIISQQKWNSSH